MVSNQTDIGAIPAGPPIVNLPLITPAPLIECRAWKDTSQLLVVYDSTGAPLVALTLADAQAVQDLGAWKDRVEARLGAVEARMRPWWQRCWDWVREDVARRALAP